MIFGFRAPECVQFGKFLYEEPLSGWKARKNCLTSIVVIDIYGGS